LELCDSTCCEGIFLGGIPISVCVFFNLFRRDRFFILFFLFLQISSSFAQQVKPWLRREFPSVVANNTFWIGTPKGLYQYRYEEDTWAIFGTHNSLPSNNVQILLWDGEWLWAGTPDGVAAGDVKLNKWLVYSAQNGLPGSRILSIAAEKDYVWVGTDRGAARYDKLIQEWEQFTTHSGLPDSVVFDIVADDDLVYFATSNGLAEYDIQFEKWRYYGKQNNIPSDTIRFIYPTADYLWLFTDQGPARFNKKLRTSVPYPDPRLRYQAIRDMAVESEQMWLATEDGIFIYDPANAIWREFPEGTNLPDQSILALSFYQDRKWFITEKGISLLNSTDKSWRRFDRTQGLSTDIYKAATTFLGRTFLINEETIDHYRPDENRFYVYPLAEIEEKSRGGTRISLDREKGSFIQFGENARFGLSGTKLTNKYWGEYQYQMLDRSGSFWTKDLTRSDLKAQLELPNSRTFNGFYDNTDLSQTLYGIKYRGNETDWIQEAGWGDIRVEQGKNELLPSLGIFGTSARMEIGKKTERYKQSLFSARGFAGERTTAKETEFFTGNLRNVLYTFADTDYIRHSIFRIAATGEKLDIDEGSEKIFTDDGDPATNTANTRLNTTMAGITGDFDKMHPVIDYKLDAKAGIIRFSSRIEQQAAVVLSATSHSVYFERILKKPGEWENALVNWYSVGGIEILPCSFSLEIFDATGGQHPLTEFGLDRDADGRVDPEFIDYKNGTLTFPQEKPFPASVYDSLYVLSHFRLQVQFQSEIPTFTLAHTNLLRGSEKVMVDGELLIPGNDYILDYTVGTLLFLKEGIIAEDSEIQVDYEYYKNTQERFQMGEIGFSPSDNALIKLNAFGFNEEKPDGSLESTQGLDFFGEFRWRAKGLDFRLTPQVAGNRAEGEQGHHVQIRTDVSSQRIRLFSEYEKIDPEYHQLFERKFQLGSLGERNAVGVTAYPSHYLEIGGGWLNQRSMPVNGSSDTEEEWNGRALINKPSFPAISISARQRHLDSLEFKSKKNSLRLDFEYTVPQSVLKKLTFQSLHLIGVWRQSREDFLKSPVSMQQQLPKRMYDSKYFRVDFAPADRIQFDAYYRENRNQAGNSLSGLGRYPYNQRQKIFLTATVDRFSGANFYFLYQGELAQLHTSPFSKNHDQSLNRSLISTLRIYPGRWISFLSPFTFQLDVQPTFRGFMRNVTRDFFLAERFWEFPGIEAVSYFEKNDIMAWRNEWRPFSFVTIYLDFESGKGLTRNWNNILQSRHKRIFQKTEIRPSMYSLLTIQYQHVRDEKLSYSTYTTDNPMLWLENRWSEKIQTKCNVSLWREVRQYGNLSESTMNITPLVGMTYRLSGSGYRLEIRNDASVSVFRSRKPSLRFDYNSYSNALSLDYYPVSVLILQLKANASYRDYLQWNSDYLSVGFEIRLTAQL
jgi:hypothetical protein